jgi:hypothetical protein
MMTWPNIVVFAVVSGIVFFTALSGYGEETEKGIIQKNVKTLVTDNHAMQKDKKYNLISIIDYALKNNQNMRNAGKDMEIGQYEADIARANRMPKIDLGEVLHDFVRHVSDAYGCNTSSGVRN